MHITRVYDNKDTFSHLEIHQGENSIEISLAPTNLDSNYHPEKWENLKEIVESHREAVRRETDGQG